MQKININYADYARQGFFQLMFVSVINLIVILVTKKYAAKNNKYLNETNHIKNEKSIDNKKIRINTYIF